MSSFILTLKVKEPCSEKLSNFPKVRPFLKVETPFETKAFSHYHIIFSPINFFLERGEEKAIKFGVD